MKVVAAYLLALLGGNTSPSADDLKNILGSVLLVCKVLNCCNVKP
ncbi:putative ribosomal protein P2 [Helianthus annuus]|nr:putative ribosomal protein P2 [Helianthus annuus]